MRVLQVIGWAFLAVAAVMLALAAIASSPNGASTAFETPMTTSSRRLHHRATRSRSPRTRTSCAHQTRLVGRRTNTIAGRARSPLASTTSAPREVARTRTAARTIARTSRTWATTFEEASRASAGTSRTSAPVARSAACSGPSGTRQVTRHPRARAAATARSSIVSAPPLPPEGDTATSVATAPFDTPVPLLTGCRRRKRMLPSMT